MARPRSSPSQQQTVHLTIGNQFAHHHGRFTIPYHAYAIGLHSIADIVSHMNMQVLLVGCVPDRVFKNLFNHPVRGAIPIIQLGNCSTVQCIELTRPEATRFETVLEVLFTA